jgi:uncharacterized protein (TIGR00290 family)
MTEKVVFSWSGGKDSALALYEIGRQVQYEVIGLLTTVTEDFDRISMHGVRQELLDRQVAALGLPLERVYLSKNDGNEDYEAKMEGLLRKYLAKGVASVVFGDLSLEEVRKYREENLAKVTLKGIFPLWGWDSKDLAHSFIEKGFRAVITCVDTDVLDKGYAGRAYDQAFLSALPGDVDPCGENGEFHSFVHDGPIFREPVPFAPGRRVLRDDRFHFCDLLPVEEL